MELRLLTEKERLQEIFELRVIAYQHSPFSKYVNRQKYPYGYFDELDLLDTTYHWILEDKHTIIGATRIAIVQDIRNLDNEFSKLNLPKGRPFAYCGRTVVHPNFRNFKTMLQLDRISRSSIISNPEIKFALCCVGPERVKSVIRLGFGFIGDIKYDWGDGNIMTLSAFMLSNPNCT